MPRAGRPRRPRRRLPARALRRRAPARRARPRARGRPGGRAARRAVLRRSTPGCASALREEVAAILRAAGTSALLVTHDQSEALSLADTVAVLTRRPARAGRHARGGLRAPAHALGRELPRRRRRAARARRATASRSASSAASRSPTELAGDVQLVVRPESVAIGHRSSRDADAPRRRRRPLVLRARPARRAPARRAAAGCAAAASASRPGTQGDHVRVWIDGPVTALGRPISRRRAPRGRGRRRRSRTRARRRRRSRCG